MNPLAVTIFHPNADPEVFDAWVSEVRSAAAATPGFVAFTASIRRDAPLDWAIAAARVVARPHVYRLQLAGIGKLGPQREDALRPQRAFPPMATSPHTTPSAGRSGW